LANFTCALLDGTSMDFKQFLGKVVLIENTASM
jgi:glutathione peroxidase-family protein